MTWWQVYVISTLLGIAVLLLLWVSWELWRDGK